MKQAILRILPSPHPYEGKPSMLSGSYSFSYQETSKVITLLVTNKRNVLSVKEAVKIIWEIEYRKS